MFYNSHKDALEGINISFCCVGMTCEAWFSSESHRTILRSEMFTSSPQINCLFWAEQHCNLPKDDSKNILQAEMFIGGQAVRQGQNQ